ncbi:MAG: DUF4835 family protein [Bacteroidetes bacterium]|nr:DUF4835 family protein [Bacteroidota bacterium]
MRRLFIFLLIIFSGFVSAQELNCVVQVLTSQIQGDKRIYETMQKAIFEFVNNTRWTRDVYKNDERIECSILINVTERSSDDFKATIQIQSRRPVYKASYNSVLFNYIDQEFQFRYVESQPLEFNETTHISNLTSVLAFYANMIIGLDYDSFSLNGGTPYFQKANAIVNNAQNDQAAKGWKSFESQRNRYWMVNNLLDPVYAPIREFNYKYHRLGLDVMAQSKDQGKAVIVENMTLLQKAYQARPASFTLQVFFNAKGDELVNIFSGAFPDEKTKVVNILNQVDPANSNKYQKILTAN